MADKKKTDTDDSFSVIWSKVKQYLSVSPGEAGETPYDQFGKLKYNPRPQMDPQKASDIEGAFGKKKKKY